MRLVTRDAARVHGHSLRNPGLSIEQRSYPVVLLRAGASTSVLNYSTLAEDLASHGYIVAGIDAPYRTGLVVFPDGRVVRRTRQNDAELCGERPPEEQAACIQPLFDAWVSDMRFAVDRLEQLNASDPSGRFTGRLDLTRVGAFGHSFGGAQAAQFCHDDPRCKAAIDIDGRPFGSVIAEGMPKPFMFVVTGDIHKSDADTVRIRSDIRSIHDHLPHDTRLCVVINGAFHFTFSDDGAVLKSGALRAGLRLSGVLGIDARRQLEITAFCVQRFFDAHLGNGSPSALRASFQEHPEVELFD
jgi:predicted dienelactone hydrolase